MASAQDPRKRQIKIKTGVVKRVIFRTADMLGKEKVMYEKEVVDQEKKIENMKVEGKDEYDIKKQGEVLEESRAMIPDSKRRLKTAFEELKNLLAETESDLGESQEFKEAQKILDETVFED